MSLPRNAPVRALVIAEPWLGMILAGRKTWEMRTKSINIRGEIGLIRKGSGHIVGIAELVDSLPPLDLAGLAANVDSHGIPPDQHACVLADGWVVPWVLRHARSLARPVAYDHPFGAVTWVTLAPEVGAAVAEAANSAVIAPAPLEAEPMATQSHRKAAANGTDSAGIGGTVRLTAGNIRNGHIYLRTLNRLIPPDVIGGPNAESAAPRQLTVVFDPGPTVETDIAGDKMILRSRGPVRVFFEASGAKEGDSAIITCTDPYSWRISLQRGTTV